MASRDRVIISFNMDHDADALLLLDALIAHMNNSGIFAWTTDPWGIKQWQIPVDRAVMSSHPHDQPPADAPVYADQ